MCFPHIFRKIVNVKIRKYITEFWFRIFREWQKKGNKLELLIKWKKLLKEVNAASSHSLPYDEV